MAIDFEQRRRRIELIAKVVGLAIVALLVEPFIYTTIRGMVGLVITATFALGVVNIAVPWLSVSLANWRLKVLKAAASANPIETLENQYAAKQVALIKIRENIKEFYSVVQELWNQIQEHNERFPNKQSQFTEKYEKMKSLLDLRRRKYKQAQQNLEQFAQLIEEKRSDWKIAQSAARASKLANVGEDFQSKLLQDSALSTIQDGLNMAFSELEVSLLDEQPLADTPSNVTALPASAPLKTLSAPKPLDLEFVEEQQSEPVKRRK